MLSLLPVKSNKELPKNLVKACVIKLSKISVSAPIKCGDLVYKNILGTEVDIIASRDMEERWINILWRVEGEASRNNFLLQFMVDMLNIKVERPKILEGTALGTLYFTGLASG